MQHNHSVFSMATPPPFSRVSHHGATRNHQICTIARGSGWESLVSRGLVWFERWPKVVPACSLGLETVIWMVIWVFTDWLTGGAKSPYHMPPYPSYPRLLYRRMTASYWSDCGGPTTQFGRFNSAQTISLRNHSGQRGSASSSCRTSHVVHNPV